MTYTPRIMEKAWDPSTEPQIFEEWEREGVYRFDVRDRREIFSIDTPPPYPSGRPWHIGAAAHYSQIDMISRTARMLGRSVYFPIGIDRNGLPVELYTERKYGVSLRDTSREKLIELCRSALDDLEAEMIEIMRRMGMSCDFKDYYRTDSEEYRRLTQETFLRLWEKGLIYEAKRPNNYCPECGTTIADAEVVYEDLPTHLTYIDFTVEETKEKIVVATTRPELLCSCQLVIVNPDDERYRRYHRAHAVIPLYGRRVQIRPHPYARPEFGTGVVMVCSYGDYGDVLLFRELGLTEIIAVDEEGRMTQEAGPYRGLTVREARGRVVEDLQGMGLVRKSEVITHRIPVCERSDTPVEIIPMGEYYVKQLDLLPALRRIAHKMTFHPDAHRQILLNWIDSVAIDWPISRRRYYGTEVPLWYCKRCGAPHAPPSGRYHQPWREPAPFTKCERCGCEDFVGDGRTLDTWMDSSISPLYITGYRRADEFFRRTYPVTLRPQAKDIVRTWLYYTILRCYQLTRRPPFKRAWIMGHGVDEKGERMSKSRGNVIDPLPILQTHGADAFRFWAASEASLGSDFRCSEERVKSARRFLTKLWNISRFISSFPYPRRARLTASDRWILGELSRLTRECVKGYERLDFFVPSNSVREFLWNILASHYVEMVKARAYGQGFGVKEQRAACYTLHTCLKTGLLLLAPIIPFLTERVWRLLYGEKSIHLQRLPRAVWSTSLCKYTQKIVDFNSTVWNMKKARGVSLKEPVMVEVPAELRAFSRDLRSMHRIPG